MRYTQAVCTVIHVLTQTEASAREQKPPWRGACFRALRQQRPVRGGGVPRNKKHWSTFVFEMMTFLREWPRPISYLHLTPPYEENFTSILFPLHPTNILFALCPSWLLPPVRSLLSTHQPISVGPLWLYLPPVCLLLFPSILPTPKATCVKN